MYMSLTCFPDRGGSGGSLEPLSGTKLFQFHGEIYEKNQVKR